MLHGLEIDGWLDAGRIHKKLILDEIGFQGYNFKRNSKHNPREISKTKWVCLLTEIRCVWSVCLDGFSQQKENVMRPWFLLCMLPGIISTGFAANELSASSPLPSDKGQSVIQAQNASGQGQTTIVDEGGSLKIVDSNKKPNQYNADASAANSSNLNGASVLPPGASTMPTQNSATQNTNVPAKTNSPAAPLLSPNMSSSAPNAQTNTQVPSQLKSTEGVAKSNDTNANPLPAEAANAQNPMSSFGMKNGLEQMKITPEQWKEIEDMVKAKIKMFQEENQRKSNP